jgi:hypothetical protein
VVDFQGVAKSSRYLYEEEDTYMSYEEEEGVAKSSR